MPRASTQGRLGIRSVLPARWCTAHTSCPARPCGRLQTVGKTQFVICGTVTRICCGIRSYQFGHSDPRAAQTPTERAFPCTNGAFASRILVNSSALPYIAVPRCLASPRVRLSLCCSSSSRTLRNPHSFHRRHSHIRHHRCRHHPLQSTNNLQPLSTTTCAALPHLFESNLRIVICSMAWRFSL